MLVRFLLLSVVFSTPCFAQYQFSGQADEQVVGKTIYLSLIEDYRKMSRISFDQIIRKSQIDSLGNFKFEGDNLPNDNRIYRIHIDECSDAFQNSEHFFGSCESSKSILFIANNHDTVSLPKSFGDQTLCEVISTNDNSAVLLEIDRLKEEMAFDFYDVQSRASQELNSKKWFSTLQQFGQNLDEPLAELYIYDFLSDKRNDTYSYYLQDVAGNQYYGALADRLRSRYPEAKSTDLYLREIGSDILLSAQRKPSSSNWIWVLASLLAISALLNLYFLWKGNKTRKNLKRGFLEKLTPQEQKIVEEIRKDKTNKQIASDLFISTSTVKTHINNLYKKLNVSSRDEIKRMFG